MGANVWGWETIIKLYIFNSAKLLYRWIKKRKSFIFKLSNPGWWSIIPLTFTEITFIGRNSLPWWKENLRRPKKKKKINVPQPTSADEQEEQKYGQLFGQQPQACTCYRLIMSYLHLGFSEEERKPRQPFYKIKNRTTCKRGLGVLQLQQLSNQRPFKDKAHIITL